MKLKNAFIASSLAVALGFGGAALLTATTTYAYDETSTSAINVDEQRVILKGYDTGRYIYSCLMTRTKSSCKSVLPIRILGQGLGMGRAQDMWIQVKRIGKRLTENSWKSLDGSPPTNWSFFSS